MSEFRRPTDVAIRKGTDIAPRRPSDIAPLTDRRPLLKGERPLVGIGAPVEEPQSLRLRDRVLGKDITVVGGTSDEVTGVLSGIILPKLERPDTRVHIIGLDRTISTGLVSAANDAGFRTRSQEVSPASFLANVNDPRIVADVLVGAMPDTSGRTDERKVEKAIVAKIFGKLGEPDRHGHLVKPTLPMVRDALQILMGDPADDEHLSKAQKSAIRGLYGDQSRSASGLLSQFTELHAHVEDFASRIPTQADTKDFYPQLQNHALPDRGFSHKDAVEMVVKGLLHGFSQDKGMLEQRITVVDTPDGPKNVITAHRVQPVLVVPGIDRLDPDQINIERLMKTCHDQGIETLRTQEVPGEKLKLTGNKTIIALRIPDGVEAKRVAEMIGEEWQEEKSVANATGSNNGTSLGTNRNLEGKGPVGKLLARNNGDNKGTNKGTNEGTTVTTSEQLRHEVMAKEIQRMPRGKHLILGGNGEHDIGDLRKENGLGSPKTLTEQLAERFPEGSVQIPSEAEFRALLGITFTPAPDKTASWAKRDRYKSETLPQENAQAREKVRKCTDTVVEAMRAYQFTAGEFVNAMGTFAAPDTRGYSDDKENVLLAFANLPEHIKYNVLKQLAEDPEVADDVWTAIETEKNAKQPVQNGTVFEVPKVQEKPRFWKLSSGR